MYYPTRYDTFGYVFFQCLYMGADGETLTLLTRTPDVRQAEHTSVIQDISALKVWKAESYAKPCAPVTRPPAHSPNFTLFPEACCSGVSARPTRRMESPPDPR